MKSVKSCIQRKKLVFKQGIAADIQTSNKELKIEILKAKQRYKCELENKMGANYLGSVWSSMKTVGGLQEGKGQQSCHSGWIQLRYRV